MWDRCVTPAMPQFRCAVCWHKSFPVCANAQLRFDSRRRKGCASCITIQEDEDRYGDDQGRVDGCMESCGSAVYRAASLQYFVRQWMERWRCWNPDRLHLCMGPRSDALLVFACKAWGGKKGSELRRSGRVWSCLVQQIVSSGAQGRGANKGQGALGRRDTWRAAA